MKNSWLKSPGLKIGIKKSGIEKLTLFLQQPLQGFGGRQPLWPQQPLWCQQPLWPLWPQQPQFRCPVELLFQKLSQIPRLLLDWQATWRQGNEKIRDEKKKYVNSQVGSKKRTDMHFEFENYFFHLLLCQNSSRISIIYHSYFFFGKITSKQIFMQCTSHIFFRIKTRILLPSLFPVRKF